jgi:hypothetical protein
VEERNLRNDHKEEFILNYNRDVQKYWLQDVPGYIQKADENWPKLIPPGPRPNGSGR